MRPHVAESEGGFESHHPDMPFCSIDFETHSAVDLKAAGVHVYAVDPSTDLWCFAWAIDGAEPALWTPGQPFPDALRDWITAGGEMRAFNAQFERLIWQHIGVPRHGFPPVALEQWVCTAAEAAAMALPRSLGQCAAALGLPVQKDEAGQRLMLQLARPKTRPATGACTWWDTPEKLTRLYAYCAQDVRVETQVAACVRRLTPTEREVYLLDQRINDRGLQIDRPLIGAMQSLADRALEEAAATLRTLTGGAVTSATQLGAMRRWLAQEGSPVASLDKQSVAELLESDLAPRVRDLLELRAETAKSSVAKLQAMLTCAGTDDRMRGLLLYHGAGTGRWTGRLVQPHNFPRPSVPDPEYFLPQVLAGEYDGLDLQAPVLEILSSLLRACLVAAPGHRFIAADYAGIEARITNWFAGQWDIVAKFAAGASVYMYNAVRMAEMQGAPLPDGASKSSHPLAYQAGKAVELGCGFGMGPAKFETTAADMFQLTISPEEAQQFVQFYRTTHPQVVQCWKDLQRAAREAVETPGATFWVGEGCKVAFTKRGGYLWVILPSGRPLCYARPALREVEAPWSTEEAPATVTSVLCWGVNSYTRRWEEFALYGGLLLENIVQAIARDLMAEGMRRVEAAGYPVVLTVHDEVLAEVPLMDDLGVDGVLEWNQVQQFSEMLATLPVWAQGGSTGVPLPLEAEGWSGLRYRK